MTVPTSQPASNPDSTSPLLPAQNATSRLMAYSEADLYRELGQRLKQIARDPSGSADFDLQVGPQIETLGAVDDIRTFGEQYFNRVNQQVYALICGTETENGAERTRLLDAFNLGRDAVTSTLAALLVAQLGLAPAIAAVMATLVIKLFFQPAHGAMCDVWKTHLQPSNAPA